MLIGPKMAELKVPHKVFRLVVWIAPRGPNAERTGKLLLTVVVQPKAVPYKLTPGKINKTAWRRGA